MEILFTNLADSGNYICRTFTVDNETEVLAYEDVHDLTVYDKPSPPPGEPTVTVLNDTAMMVAWEPSKEDNNSPITKYYVQFK